MTRPYLWGPRSSLGAAVAVAAFAIDRVHKWYMLDIVGMAERGVIEVTAFFNLVMVWNQGVSYGLFQQGSDAGRLALVALNVAVSAALWVWLARTHGRLAAISLALVIGGALGNALDRVVYGAVADFFHFHAFGWSWYVFNLADVAIVAGVIGLLYESFTDSHKSAPKPD